MDNEEQPKRKYQRSRAQVISKYLQKRARKKEKQLKSVQNAVSKLRADATKSKENIKKVDEALTGKKTTVVTTENLADVPPSLAKYTLDQEIIFAPNDGPQSEFLAASEREVFYGGARGGGKSYAMLVDPLRYCDKPVHRALLIRRTLPELRDLIDHSRRLYPRAFPGAKFREEEKVWRFPSGARIEFGYAENMADALRYQGQSYTWIGVDELPQYPTPDIWNMLRSSLRSVDPSIPEYMRATGNPGNIGSRWVRELFIDPATWGKPFEVPIDTPTGIERISRRFIPARLSDNPYLTQTKNYMIMLASLPEVQRKQFLEGDWDVFDNAAFPEFKRSLHVVEPFKVPKGWVTFRAADWGYSSYACCLWFAVDYENTLYVIRELYTRKITADIFAQKVRMLSADDSNHRYGVMDMSVWAKRGDIGPSIIDTMRENGVLWRPSDRSTNSRKNGKMEVHRRLGTDLLGKPRLKIFSTCTNLIRTLPQLPLDVNDQEDVDTEAEDHAYDALRYGCMSRPVNALQMQDMIATIANSKPRIADPVLGY